MPRNTILGNQLRSSLKTVKNWSMHIGDNQGPDQAERGALPRSLRGQNPILPVESVTYDGSRVGAVRIDL